MLSKSVGFVFVVVLLTIYGYTNGTAKNYNKSKDNNRVTTVTAIASNIKQVKKIDKVFKDSFLVYQEDFNELVTLLENEFENTILEADRTNFEDFVLSKTTKNLLVDLDITYVTVHTVLNEKDKATVFTLGDTWGSTTHSLLVYAKTALKEGEPLAANWYQVQGN